MNNIGNGSKVLTDYSAFLKGKCDSIRSCVQHVETVANDKGIGGVVSRVGVAAREFFSGGNASGDAIRNYTYLYNGLRFAGAAVAVCSVFITPFLIYAAGISLTLHGLSESQKSNPDVEKPSSASLLLKVILLPLTVVVSGIFVAISPVGGIDFALKALPTTPWLLESLWSAQTVADADAPGGKSALFEELFQNMSQFCYAQFGE